MGNPAFHTPVLCREAIEALVVHPGGIYVDGTTGGGGHAEQICRSLRAGGRLLCCDADREALEEAARRLAEFGPRVAFIHTRTEHLTQALAAAGVHAIHGLLLDLGVSSYQLDEPGRGFGFHSTERLDMRMDRGQALTAWDVVNTYDVRTLGDLLFRFGEEHHASRIARRIVARRPIDSPADLSAAVESCAGGRFLTKTLARVFQGIRIHVNNELEALRAALPAALNMLVPGGRIVVIAYHSLEDRIVKEFFRREAAEVVPSGHKLVPDMPRVPLVRIITTRPVVPGDEEIARNPRARSARMRVAERWIEGV